jgi:nitrogenase delta subunit
MEQGMNQRMEQLLDHIMKKCLWQFHSRAWDRERQNREVIGWAGKVLLGEGDATPPDPLDRCHWVDGVALVRDWRERFPWINTLAVDEIRALMESLHARLDFLTRTGSLNAELTDPHY